MKTKILILLILPVLGLTSCIEDRVQLDQVSKEVEVERSIAIPLLKASLTTGDFTGIDYDGLEIISGDTVKLYLLNDTQYGDTLDFGGLPFEFDNLYIDYVRLHHTSRNMLPLGLRLDLYLFNDSIQENIDTISFSDVPGGEFLTVPDVDANGLVIESNVLTEEGALDFDQETMDKLFKNTTHIILNGEVPQTGSIVKILDHYTIDINLGISAKMGFTADLSVLDSLLTIESNQNGL